MAATLAAEAFKLARHGLAVFPVKNKQPARVGWQQSSTCDPKAAERLLSSVPDATGIGLDCGKSGIVVLDFDGETGLHTLEQSNISRETVQVRTGGGGLHLFYRATGRQITTSTNRDLGVDIRAAHGLVVLPPSLHPNGNYYAEVEGHGFDEIQIATLTDDELAFIDHVQDRNQGKSDEAADLQHAANTVERIGHEEALAILRTYVERDRENLQQRDYYLSAKMMLVKAVMTGQIERRTAEEGIVLLACDNAEWQENNMRELAAELRSKTLPRIAGDFYSKFNWKPRHVAEKEFHDSLAEEAFARGLPTDEFAPANVPAHEPVQQVPTGAAQLLMAEFKPLTFYVQDLITPGLTLLAAPQKAGKSYLVLRMAIDIARGIPFLDRETMQADVLYLALEDSPRRLQRRLYDVEPNIRPEDVQRLDIIYYSPKLQVPDARGNYSVQLTPENNILTYLDTWVNRGKKVFIIDVFQKIRMGTGNQNMYEAEYRECALLQSWAMHWDVCLILLHHFKKGSQGMDPVERVGGSVGITGAADTVITIERENRTDKRAKFSVTGRDVESQEFYCDFDNGIWTCAGSVEANAAQAKRKEYESNPIVGTIRHLLTEKEKAGEEAVVRITATDLRNEMLTRYGYEARNYKVDKREMEKLQADLYLYDRISYDYHLSGQRWHEFRQGKLEALEWEDEIP